MPLKSKSSRVNRIFRVLSLLTHYTLSCLCLSLCLGLLCSFLGFLASSLSTSSFFYLLLLSCIAGRKEGQCGASMDSHFSTSPAVEEPAGFGASSSVPAANGDVFEDSCSICLEPFTAEDPSTVWSSMIAVVLLQLIRFGGLTTDGDSVDLVNDVT